VPFVDESEPLQVDLPVAVAGLGEELLEQLAEVSGAQVVKVVLAVTTKTDELALAQESEMVADGRLGLLEEVTQGGNVHLPLAGQGEENLDPGLVSQKLKDFGELLDGVLGNPDGVRGRGCNPGAPRFGGGIGAQGTVLPRWRSASRR
jgi:hypothetical protein